MKRFVVIALAGVFLLSCLCVPALAESFGIVFAGGDGTEADPYEIASKEQFIAFASGGDAQSDSEKTTLYAQHFKLTNDIDLEGLKISSIGAAASYSINVFFTGVFDGNGRTIRNIAIDNSNNYTALFIGLKSVDGTGGVIQNLNIDRITVTGASTTGSLVSDNRGGRIENCHVTNGSVSGTGTVGGLVGKNQYNSSYLGRIILSSFSGTVDGSGSDIGGLVGYDNGFYAGTDVPTIERSYAKAEVSGGTNTGGLVGTIYKGNMADCFFIGSVAGSSKVGGLIGRVPWNNPATIQNCYATDLTAGTGGLFGEFALEGGTVNNLYFLSNAGREIFTSTSSDAIALDATVSGKTEAELAAMAPVLNGDRSPVVWRAAGQSENSGYPCLESMDSGGSDPTPSVTPLPAPQGLVWEGTTAVWQAVDNASGYNLQLYFNGKELGGTSTADSLQYNFADRMTDAGIYTFSVTALGDGETCSNSEPSMSAETEYIPENSYVNITTADQLIELSNLTADIEQKEAWSKNYRLANDINMADKTVDKLMKPIGSTQNPFSGIFDGNGFAISNLSMSAVDGGLFHTISAGAKVSNLILRQPIINSNGSSGLLARTNNGQISDCAVIDGRLVSRSGANLGGIVYENNDQGVIERTFVAGGFVSCEYTNYPTTIGGFIANNRGSITECYANLSVNAPQAKWVGGFVGQQIRGTLSDCYTTGSVNAASDSGGFCGRLGENAALINCYSSNDVTVTSGGSPFIGVLQWGGQTTVNCYYNADKSLPQGGEALVSESGVPGAQLKSAQMGILWTADPTGAINGGFPYLKNLPAPAEQMPEKAITVLLMIASYADDTFRFAKQKGPLEISVTGDNPTISDVLEAARDQLPYEAVYTKEYGYYVVSLDGMPLDRPDAWMFTVNDELARYGVSTQTVADGDKVLWYPGKPGNLYTAPKWDTLLGVGGGSGQESPYFDGRGTEDEPYLIRTAKDLENVRQHPQACFRVENPIDLTGVLFEPIGSEMAPFTGIFDGNNQVISNLTIQKDESSQNLGLFGVLYKARVRNVVLQNASVTGGTRLGLLAGVAKEGEDENNQNAACAIGNCHVSGTITGLGQENSSKKTYMGGLVGWNQGNSLKNDGTDHTYFYSAIDSSSANVTVSGGAEDIQINGVAGGLTGCNDGIIRSSYAAGNITGGTLAGGLTGTNDGQIFDSYATGNVSAMFTAGGFTGMNLGEIKNSFATGNVVSLSVTGENFGGFAGAATDGKIENCVSSGTVLPGSGYCGGFIGKFSGVLNTAGGALNATLVQSYGNSQSAVIQLKGLGSYISGGSAEGDAAAAAVAVTKQEAEEKLQLLAQEIGFTEIVSNDRAIDQEAAQLEAERYADVVRIPSTLAINSDITDLTVRRLAETKPAPTLLRQIAQKEYKGAVAYGATTGRVRLIGRGESEEKTETVYLIFSQNGEYAVRKITVIVQPASMADNDVAIAVVGDGENRTVSFINNTDKTIDATAYIAKYCDGVFVEAESVPIDSLDAYGFTDYMFSVEGYDQVRIFVWNAMSPLCPVWKS